MNSLSSKIGLFTLTLCVVPKTLNRTRSECDVSNVTRGVRLKSRINCEELVVEAVLVDGVQVHYILLLVFNSDSTVLIRIPYATVSKTSERVYSMSSLIQECMNICTDQMSELVFVEKPFF